jgi:Na+-transporting NADH:ubiquinone oxidoreductase subunit NqrC
MNPYTAVSRLLSAIREADTSVKLALTQNKISSMDEASEVVKSFYMMCQEVILDLVSKVYNSLIEPKMVDMCKQFSALEIQFRIIGSFTG